LDIRPINNKLANDIIPKCIKYLKYQFPYDDEEEPDTLYKIIKNASKVEILSINGSEEHLNTLNEIANNVGKSCKYLYLGFEGECDSSDLGEKYVEMFSKFE
jgi:hypothetical protein